MQFPARPRVLRRGSAVQVDPPTEGALSPAAVRRGLRLSTVEGALATVHISIT
ncbi:MAG: hypothetical protein H7Z42_00690, partial [Roseiflexaceae bacterium]|nr:hypothetical protein [Roseiflexaceae bacterium]